MKTTLIGHACILFESKGTTLLSDPCLFSLHFEELNYYFPRVEIHRDRFPRPDAVYLSHRHQDHFDIRTLAYLPKDLKILCPDDAIMLECLKELEYTDVTVVKDFEAVRVKNLTLIPTPSLTQDYYPEHGLIIQDGEITVWNQVDTIVSPEIIKYIHRLCGQVDFAHVRFEPLLEQNFTYNKDCALPFDEYSSFLKVAGALSPKFAVPGSAGEHFYDRAEFLNHFVFPATQEQFIKDLEAFSPEIRSSTYYPGDVAEIKPEGVKIHRQQTELVTRQQDDVFRTAFNPLYEVPRIRTLTDNAEQRVKEKETVTQFIESGSFLEKLTSSEVMAAYQHWGLGYRLEIFDEDSSDIWSLDFSREPVIQKGYFGTVNLYEGIAYSEFYRLIQGETNWDFVGASGQYRTFHNIYRVARGNFEFYPQEKKFPQPLQEVFPPNRDMDREKYMKDVRRWKGAFDQSGPAKMLDIN
ncbi:MAG: MBL fold metallo-hydrolase [Nitrospinota bacterium]|nr:MBL fold metallo-hydrolase [Nitrospinota bacterium]